MSDAVFFDLRAAALEKPSLLNAIVAPRPIAWVSTIDAQGVTNLAPFSYFNLLSNSPPTVVFSCVNPADRSEKDTLGNVRATGQFVINMVSRELLELMHRSSAPWPAGTSEFEHLRIDPVASAHVRPPRVRAAPAALECTLLHLIPIAPERPGEPGCTAVIGRVVGLHVAAHLLDARGRFSSREAGLVARIGGHGYAELGAITELAPVAQGLRG